LNLLLHRIRAKERPSPASNSFSAAAPPRIAVLTSSSTLPRRYAPEQGTRPATAHRSTRLRLFDRRTAPVSTAIMPAKQGGEVG